MTQPNASTPVEAHSTAALLHNLPQPLTALANGDVPAVVLRGAYPPDHCKAQPGASPVFAATASASTPLLPASSRP